MKHISTYVLLIFLVLLTGALTLPVLATEEIPTIGLSEAYPLKGQEVQVLISHASYPHLENFTVTVTYRPNSDASQVEVLGNPNDNGIITWKPRHAGITTITAEAPAFETFEEVKLSKNVSVRFGAFPPLGILIFVLATLTLFGGLIVVLLKTTKPKTT